MEPTLTNIMANGQFQNPNTLDLDKIACKTQGSALNRKKFPGIVIRKSQPKGTILLFKSNKFIIIGCASIQDAQCLSRRLLKDIKKIINENICLKSFRVTNLIASAHIGYRLNIGLLAEQPNAMKDERFHGVFLKMKSIRCAILFANGKMLLHGATSFQKITDEYKNLVKYLVKFKAEEKKGENETETNMQEFESF